MSKPEILLIVSGSIAAFKAAALASQLVQDGCGVQTVMTGGGRQFVGDATFEGEVGWSNELGHGTRAPEPSQTERDVSVRIVER